MAKKSTSEKVQIRVEKRKTLGRKVKSLRQQGILPANVYGKKVKSLAVQLERKEFLPVWQKVGETGLVDLQVKGEEKPRPVLIHSPHLDPVTDLPLHVDFHQVDLTEKVTTDIPVEIVGESPAVAQKVGVLIQPLAEVEVEALPAELPDHFNVDVSSLKEVDDGITVADLKVSSGVKILTDPDQVLAKIEPPAKEEEAPAPPAGEVEGEEVPAEGEEAPAPPAGEGEKKGETKPEEKPAE